MKTILFADDTFVVQSDNYLKKFKSLFPVNWKSNLSANCKEAPTKYF